MDKHTEDMVIERARVLYRAERARHARPRRSAWRRLLDTLRGR